MTTSTPSDIQQWLAENYDPDKIRKKLTSLGYEESAIDSIVKEHMKGWYAKRQTTGFIMLAVGAVLGFISCVLTLTNPVPALYYWILYGLTSIAVIILMAGLYYVLE